jgi:hypothetical protein
MDLCVWIVATLLLVAYLTMLSVSGLLGRDFIY